MKKHWFKKYFTEITPYKQQCIICGIVVINNSEMNQHLSILHSDVIIREKRYKCEICGKICDSESHLKYHNQNRHTLPWIFNFFTKTEKGVKCKYCDFNKNVNRSAYHKIGLGIHTYFEHSNKLSEHQKLEVEIFKCKDCGKLNANKSQLKRHTLIHSKENNHACHMCDKKYRDKKSLIVHMRIHTGDRPFQCDYCSKQFKSSTHLRQHRRTHTGETPLQCNKCLKKFMFYSTRDNHKCVPISK